MATAVKEKRIPPVMLDPTLLPPNESWEYRCNVTGEYVDRKGVPRSRTCAVVTQGGRAGYRAHVRVVHGGTA